MRTFSSLLVACLGLMFASGCALAASSAPKPEAIVIVSGDMHSAYDRTAQYLARVDKIRAENPGVPVLVAVNGDTFELGNAVARRSSGAVEFALFAALAKRGPTVVNFGNHEPEFYGVGETLQKLGALGITVVGGNVAEKDTGAAPQAFVTLALGKHKLGLIGVTTDRLETFRAPLRPTLDLRNPVTVARAAMPEAFKDSALPVVLSHAGLKHDREILALVPEGTLFAGAHDHLRFIHKQGRTVYFHSGSWTDYISVARLMPAATGAFSWSVEQMRISPTDAADPALAELIAATLKQHLALEENAIVGQTKREFSPSGAATFAVEAARIASDADLALVGATTFGAGLPNGDVSRYAFDACVRFDGPLFAAEVDGEWLTALLARSNQGPDTPFAQRGGENLIAATRGEIVAGKRYRFVTTDWIAKNAKLYLGENPPVLTELPGLKLKAAVLGALSTKK